MKNFHYRIRDIDRRVHGDPRLPLQPSKHPGSKKRKPKRKKK